MSSAARGQDTEAGRESVEHRAFLLALGASGRHRNAAVENRAQCSCCPKVSASSGGSFNGVKKPQECDGPREGSGGRHGAGVEEEATLEERYSDCQQEASQ